MRFFWGLMGVYLLNISVDTADPNPEHIPEDLTINDQESIIEIAIEKILGFEDAIPEYDDPDHEDHNKKSNVKIDLTVQYAANSNDSQSFFETRRQKHPDFESVLTGGFYQINTPPPKI
ncbi:hypothetical protein LV716_07730 [Flagellimonas sp. HMM57]|uniref:hypothetical protein n=2 Tax=unclassified Flagellimonas TaxID=2644544 RepID=UPI001F36B6BE|nr:hypothetical protein [Flagellimonas sp. HMM57]UII77647.1 hypothetical protein LV716_07730 [Flagellimonas sp. HMM57]